MALKCLTNFPLVFQHEKEVHYTKYIVAFSIVSSSVDTFSVKIHEFSVESFQSEDNADNATAMDLTHTFIN